MSLRTSAWDFPQKLHMVRLEARAIGNNLRKAGTVPDLLGFFGQLCEVRNIFTRSNDFVNETVFFPLLRSEIRIALAIDIHFLDGLAGVMGKDALHPTVQLVKELDGALD